MNTATLTRIVVTTLAASIAVLAVAISSARAGEDESHLTFNRQAASFTGKATSAPRKVSRHAARTKVTVAKAEAPGCDKVTTRRECLESGTLRVLEDAEEHFGVTFELASTMRPGAIIAGTQHESQHAVGKAADVKVPKSISKRAVVKWFYAHAKGVTMTYRYMSHVHFDTGPYHKLAFGNGTKRTKHSRYARAQ